MTARSIALRTLSGTFVGPGICRKCRPDCVLPAWLDTHYCAPLREGDRQLLCELVDRVAEDLDLRQLGNTGCRGDVFAQRIVERFDERLRVLLREHEVGEQLRSVGALGTLQDANGAGHDHRTVSRKLNVDRYAICLGGEAEVVRAGAYLALTGFDVGDGVV